MFYHTFGGSSPITSAIATVAVVAYINYTSADFFPVPGRGDTCTCRRNSACTKDAKYCTTAQACNKIIHSIYLQRINHPVENVL